MIVKMNKEATASGPEGTLCAGQVGEVPDEMARAMVDGGYAVEIAASMPIAAQVAEPETATIERETATRPPQRKPKQKPARKAVKRYPVGVLGLEPLTPADTEGPDDPGTGEVV